MLPSIPREGFALIVLVTQSCLTLCDLPWTVAFQALLSMGFSLQKYWSMLPFPPLVDLPNSEIKPRSPTLQADSLPSEPPGKPSAAAAAAKSLQSCPTLCDPIDGSPPGSPVPGILQARTLEWVAVAFSEGSPLARCYSSFPHKSNHCSLTFYINDFLDLGK